MDAIGEKVQLVFDPCNEARYISLYGSVKINLSSFVCVFQARVALRVLLMREVQTFAVLCWWGGFRFFYIRWGRTRCSGDWWGGVCSSYLEGGVGPALFIRGGVGTAMLIQGGVGTAMLIQGGVGTAMLIQRVG